jgi:hypothetical protein
LTRRRRRMRRRRRRRRRRNQSPRDTPCNYETPVVAERAHPLAFFT